VLNVPPVTDWAAVTCACGKDRLTRPSQLLVAETGVVPSKMAEREMGESIAALNRRLRAIRPSWHPSWSAFCAWAAPLKAGTAIAAVSIPFESQLFIFVLASFGFSGTPATIGVVNGSRDSQLLFEARSR
jgi:hypothetical protein